MITQPKGSAVSMSIDAPNFQMLMRDYLAQTSKDIPTAINSTLYFIARSASRHTPRADRARIERELGTESLKVQAYKAGAKKGQAKLDKRGRVKTTRVMRAGVTLAALIVNAKRRKAGRPGLRGQAMKAAINKLISARVRSIGTLKAGWLGAIRTLARASGESDTEVPGSAGRPKGSSIARVARSGMNPKAMLEYRVNSFNQQHQPYIDARVKEALEKAFADEAQSKLEYLLRNKMEKTASTFYSRSKSKKR